MYAISTLIQWVFRSAIRKGEEVWLYLPSRRMRELFTEWLDNLAEGKDLLPIKLKENKEPTGDFNKTSFRVNAKAFSNKFKQTKNIKETKR